MKSRLTLGILAIVAVLVFGFSALPGQAYAAEVTLSDIDRSNMQSVLDLTKITLDAVQTQIDQNMIQDSTATLSILDNIRAYLLNMRELLGGAPVALIEYPEPIALTPIIVAPESPAIATDPAAAETPIAAAPSGEVAGSATVNETAATPETAPANSDTTSKRVFWIVLITAIIIAVILVFPKKKTVELQDASQEAPQVPQPPQQSAQPQSSEKSESAQSA